MKRTVVVFRSFAYARFPLRISHSAELRCESGVYVVNREYGKCGKVSSGAVVRIDEWS